MQRCLVMTHTLLSRPKAGCVVTMGLNVPIGFKFLNDENNRINFKPVVFAVP